MKREKILENDAHIEGQKLNIHLWIICFPAFMNGKCTFTLISTGWILAFLEKAISNMTDFIIQFVNMGLNLFEMNFTIVIDNSANETSQIFTFIYQTENFHFSLEFMEKAVHIAFQCGIFMHLTITEFHNCGWKHKLLFDINWINLKLLSFDIYVLPSETPLFSWHVLRIGFIISRNSGGGHFIPRTIEKFSQNFNLFFFSLFNSLCHHGEAQHLVDPHSIEQQTMQK